MNEEDEKEMILGLKAISKRIQEEALAMTIALDEIGQTNISMAMNGWEIHMKRIQQKIGPN